MLRVHCTCIYLQYFTGPPAVVAARGVCRKPRPAAPGSQIEELHRKHITYSGYRIRLHRRRGPHILHAVPHCNRTFSPATRRMRAVIYHAFFCCTGRPSHERARPAKASGILNYTQRHNIVRVIVIIIRARIYIIHVHRTYTRIFVCARV